MKIALLAPPEEMNRGRQRLWLPDSWQQTEPTPPPEIRERPREHGKLSPRMTLTEFVQEWFVPIILLGGDESAAQATVVLYTQALSRWVELTGDPPVAAIDDFLVEKFRKGLRTATYQRGPGKETRPLSKVTQKKHLAHMRHILYRLGPAWDPRRKTAGVVERPIHVAVGNAPTERKEPFTLEQARAMVACAEKMHAPANPLQYWRCFAALHFYTGLRSGTIKLLRREHITSKNCQPWLNVPAELVSKTGKPIKLPMHPRLVEALEPFRDSPTLLPATFCKRYLYQLHGDLQTLAGIPEDQQISPHGWRRTHACELANLGADSALAIAQKALDHADKKTTEAHYCDIVSRLIVRLPDLW